MHPRHSVLQNGGKVKAKKIFICMVLFISLTTTVSLGLNYYVRVGDSIEDIVVQMLKIQYGWKSKKFLNEITTEDFRLNMGEAFYQGGLFYLINNDLKQSFEWIDENTVEVVAFIEDYYGAYIQIFTLKKTTEGQYLISKIECDI